MVAYKKFIDAACLVFVITCYQRYSRYLVYLPIDNPFIIFIRWLSKGIRYNLQKTFSPLKPQRVSSAFYIILTLFQHYMSDI
jgi:hypothetical protein